MRDYSQDETLESKICFEKLAALHGNTIQSYRADNGRFAENDFRDQIAADGQLIGYCGVGAHHQNGLVERHIKTLTLGSRTLLLHAIQHWPEMISTILWPFASKESSRRHNLFRINKNGQTPALAFSQPDPELDFTQ